MIVSRPDRRLAATLIGVALCGWLVGCRTPGVRPVNPAVDSRVRFSIRVPDVADHAAAELAAAALISDRSHAERVLARLHAIDTVLITGGERPTGLVPVATDLVNAVSVSDRARRDATLKLLDLDDLDPALRERLSREERDDPLELADDRIWDARVTSFARAFNSVVEPIGQSILTLALAPYRLAQSLVFYTIRVHADDTLPLRRRQALEHWKRFVAQYPDSPEAEALRPRIEKAEIKLAKTRYEKLMRAAKHALKTGRVRLALVYAERALRLAPANWAALGLRTQANYQLLVLRTQQRKSIEGIDELTPAAPAAARLAVALLLPGGDVAGAARELLEADSDGSLHDEARFAQALALGEAGSEGPMWDLLDDLAREAESESNMARHARSQIQNPAINPYGAFAAARQQNQRSLAKWIFLGPFSRGLPDRRIPKVAELILDLPAIAQSMILTPIRLLRLPWLDPQPAARLAAIYGRRYLEKVPDGERADSVRKWLFKFERKRKNWIAVYQIAVDDPEMDSVKLSRLREKAAEQAMQIASREQRRSVRNAMYRRTAQEYPNTVAGKQSGIFARHEALEATPQRIRISRGFLIENPEFAGPRGLALNAHLLDEDNANSELHPNGVFLAGGRVLELHFIGPTGDGDDPPIKVYQLASEERFARIVASLEETSFRNALLDTDDPITADANRDVVFERARVGLADDIDRRPEAESTYSYLGMRERYGMVRARESILPFELVFQGSLDRLSLGAFPRIHTPRETPDAFLYR